MVVSGWLASAALAGWAIFGLRGAATKDFKFDAGQVATFNAFAPLAWAVAISWVILACHADLGGEKGLWENKKTIQSMPSVREHSIIT